MAIERTLLERAKLGEVEAIASLMNKTLSKQNRRVRVLRKATQLKLLVEADEAPPQAATVSWIEKGLGKLAIANVETAIVYGKSKQNAKPTWQQVISLSDRQSAPEADSTSTVNESKSVPEIKSVEKEPALDLSEYCFTRNKSLLKGELTLPAKPVIQLVLTFDKLTNAQKLEALPLLDKVFRNPQFVLEDTLNAETTDWLTTISELEGPDIRKASIWMSRYCLDAKATSEQLDQSSKSEAAPEPDEAIAADAANPSDTQAEPVSTSSQKFPSTHHHPPSARAGAATSQFAQGRPASTAVSNMSRIPTWVIPAVWTLFLTIAIGLSVVKASSAYYGYPVCENALGAPDTCSLAVEVIGDEEFMAEALAEAKPISPEMRESAIEDCSEYGFKEVTSSAATRSVSTRPSREEAITILASSTEEVLPGILVTDVTQTDSYADGDTSRFACVGYAYAFDSTFDGTNTSGYMQERDGEIMYDSMGADIIPMEWPAEPYSGLASLVQDMERVDGVYNVFVRFGANTLFAAIGLFIAVLFCTSYSCQTLSGLYHAAFIMGVFETLIPFGGFRMQLAVASLGLGIASAFIKGFKVDWSEGYGSVAMGAGIVVFTRFILSVLLYVVISGLVGG